MKKPSKLSSSDPKIVHFAIPARLIHGDSVPADHVVAAHIRLLGPKERDALEASMLPLDFMGFSARLISLSLVDEHGKKICTEKDEPEIRKESADIVFAVALAILHFNGMLPPPSQNVDHGKLVSAEKTIRSEYPHWTKKEIDDCLQFMGFLKYAEPVFSFQRSYAHKYRPGTTARDLLLVALSGASEDERLAAAERFLQGRRPIHSGRWKGHRGEILNELSATADLHGRTAKGEMAARTLASIFPAAAQVRINSGIFAPEAEVVEKTKAALNEEVTHDILGETWRKQGEDADPEAIAYGLGLAGIPIADEYRTAAGAVDVIPELDLTRALSTLTDRQKRIYEALLQHGGDRKATAKALKTKPGTLDAAIHRIKKKISPPE